MHTLVSTTRILEREILVFDTHDVDGKAGWGSEVASMLRAYFPPPDHCVRLTSANDHVPRSAVIVARLTPLLPENVCGLVVIPAELEEPDRILELLSMGYEDYVCEPVRPADLVPRMRRLLSLRCLAKTGINLRFPGIIGDSEPLRRTLSEVERIATSNVTCLIYGETGSGKELFARAMHYNGRRRGAPFVSLNCGAIPDLLFENELFGHARGAYTDARQPEDGLVAVAEGGTLFLDEIDALTPAAQIKLLRLLQEGEYRPLGSSQTRRADIRVIAATNASLRDLIHLRRFREDLYYRLNVVELTVPTLRERSYDIPKLAAFFLEKYASEHQRKVPKLSASALAKLLRYSWPGNVRELQSVLQRAIVLADAQSEELTAADFALPGAQDVSTKDSVSLRRAKLQATESFERGYLIRLLAESQGNVSRAARAAGKERRTFQRLMQKYSLCRLTFLS